MQSRFLIILSSIIVFMQTQSIANAQFAAMNAIRIDVNMGGFTKQALSDARQSESRLIQDNSNLSIKKLTYSPSASARKRNLANFVAKTREIDPSGATELAKMFAANDVIGIIGKAIAPYNLRTDNVADAYTVYWTNAWLGSRGRNDTLSKQQISAVRRQAASGLLGSSDFLASSDEKKQEMADALLVQAALIEAFIDGAKSDPSLMPKVKAAIAQGAKAMGLDLYAMTLTPNGFIPAKRGSAVDGSDTVPGSNSGEQALASAAPISDKDPPNYALIAAAGGAGLGGMFLLGKMMGRKS